MKRVSMRMRRMRTIKKIQRQSILWKNLASAPHCHHLQQQYPKKKATPAVPTRSPSSGTLPSSKTIPNPHPASASASAFLSMTIAGPMACSLPLFPLLPGVTTPPPTFHPPFYRLSLSIPRSSASPSSLSRTPPQSARSH